MLEEWRDIKDYEGLYWVSNLGRVKSKLKVLKGTPDAKGYFTVTLYKNGTRETKRIHKLVAEAFLGHEPCGYKKVVDHIDNNRSNNRVDNLQLITQRENISKDIKNKTSKYTGVSWHKATSKWTARILINGKTKYLGLFENEDEAGKAYKKQLDNENQSGVIKR